MSYFVKRILIFIGILYIISYILQLVIDEGLRKSNFCTITNYCSNYKEWYDIFHSKINTNIIIQGNSRAWVHFSPKILEKNLNMSVYNLGIDGYSFPMQYTRFNIYMNNAKKKPKYIIQCVDFFNNDDKSNPYMFEQFVPYFNDKNIRKAVLYFDLFDYRDFYIPLYKYSHNKDLGRTGILNCLNKGVVDNGKYKGFRVFHKKWDSTFYKFKLAHLSKIKLKPDTNVRRMFENFLKYCNNNNIKVILIYPPVYYEAQKLYLNKDSVLNIYQTFSTKYNTPFIDYSNDSICKNKKYFYNSQHMNDIGVELFNKHLVTDLKKIIN